MKAVNTLLVKHINNPTTTDHQYNNPYRNFIQTLPTQTRPIPIETLHISNKIIASNATLPSPRKIKNKYYTTPPSNHPLQNPELVTK